MSRNPVLPYYYPTTICFIDDNASYLESLTLHTPDIWPHRIFHSGEAALAHINRADKPPNLADHCFAPIPGSTQLALDISLIEREMSQPNRFEDISVLMVDYAMPTMDGLQMCAKVEDPNIRIVLLTGVADEAMAVEAFNAGLIHQFIRKGEAETRQSTFDLVEQLRQDYFAAGTAGLASGLRALPDSYRQDDNFCSYFADLVRELEITEYYMVTDPSGYLLIDAYGRFRRLLVLDEEDLTRQQQWLATQDAPAAIQQAVQVKASMGYFYEHPSDYGNEAYPWTDMLVPAQPIVSTSNGQTWYVGIHDNPPIDIDFDLSQSSLDYYLNHLDPHTGNYTAQSRRAARRQQALESTE